MFKSLRARATILVAAVGLGGMFAAPAKADSVNLGSAAQFTVLGFNSLHDDFSLVTVNGNVGAADTSSLKIMAPSVVNGNVLIGTNATFSDDKNPSQNVHGSVLTGQNLSGAVSDALSAFNTYTALAPTQTFNGIGSATTITGNGGTNVIDINGNISKSLTLNGGANDLFILNVNGGITLGGSDKIAAGAGINPNQIVINLIGSQSVNTHVGNEITGTVIGPSSSGNLDGTFNGRLFFGGSSLTLLSGAVVNGTAVPLPPTVYGVGALLMSLVVAKRRKVAVA